MVVCSMFLFWTFLNSIFHGVFSETVEFAFYHFFHHIKNCFEKKMQLGVNTQFIAAFCMKITLRTL